MFNFGILIYTYIANHWLVTAMIILVLLIAYSLSHKQITRFVEPHSQLLNLLMLITSIAAVGEGVYALKISVAAEKSAEETSRKNISIATSIYDTTRQLLLFQRSRITPDVVVYQDLQGAPYYDFDRNGDRGTLRIHLKVHNQGHVRARNVQIEYRAISITCGDRHTDVKISGNTSCSSLGANESQDFTVETAIVATVDAMDEFVKCLQNDSAELTIVANAIANVSGETTKIIGQASSFKIHRLKATYIVGDEFITTDVAPRGVSGPNP